MMSRAWGCLLLVGLLLASVSVPAQGNPELDDSFVSLAVRGALLDNADAIDELAEAQRVHEREEKPEASFSENLAALAVVTRTVGEAGSVPQRRDVRRAMRPYTRDGNVETLERLLERLHPEDRLADAAASRRYESRRQVVNSITGAVASAFQLQFFGLIQPPLDVVDYVVVKRHYLSPEERRELAVAEDIAQDTPDHRGVNRVIVRQQPRLAATYALHARRNAEDAARHDWLLTAAWWYEQEQTLRGWDEANRSRHRDVLGEIEERVINREAVVAVGPDPDPFPADVERSSVRAVLRGEFPDTETFVALDRTTRIAMRPAIDPDPEQRLRRIDQLAYEADAPWGDIASDLVARPGENPRRAMNEAKRAARHRIQGWLLRGDDPRGSEQSLSPEDARQVESAWIQSARSAFVFDVLTRGLTYPLLPGRLFSRREIIDVAHRVPEAWEGTDEANRSLREGARALRKDRRFERAAVLAEEAGRVAQAESLRERQARAIGRELRASEDPDERLRLAMRLLNAYPEYAQRHGIAAVRVQERELADALFIVTRADLQRNPLLVAPDALSIPDDFLDGRDRNGEVGNRGVFVLPGDRIAWIDRGTEEVLVDPRPAGNLQVAYARWLALQRTGDVREVLERPRERKRIPIAIEGSAFPGVYVAPGLVPLEPDLEARRLYE